MGFLCQGLGFRVVQSFGFTLRVVNKVLDGFSKGLPF